MYRWFAHVCMDLIFKQNEQENREPVNILGEELERVTHFKYLGTSIEEEGGMEMEITKRMGEGWRNCKKCIGVLVRQKDASETERKGLQHSDQASRSYMGQKCGLLVQRRGQEKQIEVNEMRMLRWMCGVTHKDKIRNEHIRATTRVTQASKMIMERRLKNTYWGKCWECTCIYLTNLGNGREDDWKQDGKTRAKETWKRLRAGEETSRAIWRRKICGHTGDTIWWEKPEGKEGEDTFVCLSSPRNIFNCLFPNVVMPVILSCVWQMVLCEFDTFQINKSIQKLWMFFGYKKIARPNWGTNSWQDVLSDDTSS